MALFNQNGSLLDILFGSQDQGAGKTLASQANIDQADLAKIAAVGLPLLLSALNRNNQSKEGLDSFTEALGNHRNQEAQSVEELAQKADPKDGEKILGHAFKDQDSVADRLARSLNMNPNTVKMGLAILAPMVLKYLADRQSGPSMDQSQVEQDTKSAEDELLEAIRKYANSQNNQTSQGQASQPTQADQNNQAPATNQDGGLGGIIGDVLDRLQNNQASAQPDQTQASNQEEDRGGLVGRIIRAFF